jgi:hypothetical protein
MVEMADYNYRNKFSIVLIFSSLISIFLSGIFFGFTYYIMSVTHTSLLSLDCSIENNAFVSSCQDLFEKTLYPFLALKDILIWLSYFFIFAIVLGLFIAGYKGGKSAAMLGVFVGSIIGFTYLGIELSNVYRQIIEFPIMETILTPFTVYNFIMLNFPLFIFIVSLISVILAIINFQKAPVNQVTQEDLNF